MFTIRPSDPSLLPSIHFGSLQLPESLDLEEPMSSSGLPMEEGTPHFSAHIHTPNTPRTHLLILKTNTNKVCNSNFEDRSDRCGVTLEVPFYPGSILSLFLVHQDVSRCHLSLLQSWPSPCVFCTDGLRP